MEETSILVIDDDPASVHALMEYLHTEGFRTTIAPSGERALQQLERAQPDIILLDALMPGGMDGFETCRRLKANEVTRNIPVIFMTALTDTVDKVKGFEAGGADYITKPLQHEEVLARVNVQLTLRKSQQQLQAQNVLLEKQNALYLYFLNQHRPVILRACCGQNFMPFPFNRTGNIVDGRSVI